MCSYQARNALQLACSFTENRMLFHIHTILELLHVVCPTITLNYLKFSIWNNTACYVRKSSTSSSPMRLPHPTASYEVSSHSHEIRSAEWSAFHDRPTSYAYETTRHLYNMHQYGISHKDQQLSCLDAGYRNESPLMFKTHFSLLWYDKLGLRVIMTSSDTN